MENQVFNATRPESLQGLGQGATLRQVIEEALPNVNKSFENSPLISARLHMLLGTALTSEKADELAVGQFELARALFTTCEVVPVFRACSGLRMNGQGDLQDERKEQEAGVECTTAVHR